MARQSRRQVIRPDQPGTYHVYARTVRQAFLFGVDPLSGKDYTHRRLWILERMELLARSFAIEICFEAVMANHLHLILETFPRLLKRLSDQEVARRWLRVFPGKRVLDGKWIEPSNKQVRDLAKDKKAIKKIRHRLSDVSWFMSALCEYTARRANREDGVRGRFFQGRYGCRELVDEQAVLICGMYVDLNQIRAGEANTPEASQFSSVGLRIQTLQDRRRGKSAADAWLSKFSTLGTGRGSDARPSATGKRATDRGLFEMPFRKYLKLLDWVGRQPTSRNKLGKQGAIPQDLRPILERLRLESAAVRSSVHEFPRRFGRMVGSPSALVARAAEEGRSWIKGIRAAKQLFRNDALD